MTNFLLKLFVKDYKNTQDPKIKSKYGLLGSFFGLITNFIVFIIKIVIGIISSTTSIIADALNNLSDFGNNFISIFGFKFSSKKADNIHPYGYQRLEFVVSLILGIIIIELGALLLYEGITDLISFSKSIIETNHPVINNISLPLFIISVSLLSFSILVKILQSYLYFSLSKKINSMQLKVLGKDSRNDIIATTAVLIGLIISYLTTYKIDCFFTIAVSIFVIISGINIVKEAIVVLLGSRPEKKLINEITSIIKDNKKVISCHDLLIHSYGDNKFASIDIELDDKLTLNDAHEIADSIEKELYEKLNIKFTIHIDPISSSPNSSLLLSKIKKELNDINSNITLHDFHLNSKKKNISFDLILPDDFNLKENKEEIINKINSKLNHEYSLNITFDDSTTYLM